MPAHHSMHWRRRCLRWPLRHCSRWRCAERWQRSSTGASSGHKGDANASFDALAPSLPPLAVAPSFPSASCREAVVYIHGSIQRTQRRCQRIIQCAGAVVASASRSTIVPIGVVQRGGGIRPRQHPGDAKVMPTHHLMRWHCRCLRWPLRHRSHWCCAERWQKSSMVASRRHKGDANASNDALALPLPPLAVPPSFPWALHREVAAYLLPRRCCCGCCAGGWWNAIVEATRGCQGSAHMSLGHVGTAAACSGRSTLVPVGVMQRGSG